jgi:predicted RNA methylase
MNNSCKIIPFTPEKEPKEVKMSKKIFNKYFPKFDLNDFSQLKITKIGLYSIALPSISMKICNLIKNTIKTTDITVTDALANVGGMTIMFAKYFNKVNACEIVQLHCNILKNNLTVYNLNKKVNIICDDYTKIMKDLNQDVIFFDPPWGGRSYKKEETIKLEINNINIACIINRLLDNTKYIFLRVPYNFDYNNFIYLVDSNTKIRLYRLNPELKFKSQILIVVSKI